MQIINLDISNKTVVPLLYAKQGDVGKKIVVVITRNGVAYNIPSSAKVSIWYSGCSGSGNYTSIGDRSAITVSENSITVELIAQMLTKNGGGNMCIVINAQNGNQIGLWNIPYFVEELPGANSAEATQYYTAFSEAIEKLYGDVDAAVEEALHEAKESGEFNGFSPVANVMTINGEVTIMITDANGTTEAVVPPGPQGKPGQTPVRGVDYWTEADKEQMEADNEAFILAELAKRGQLKPEFANSIEECTDTTKLYVLPDGYIYGYILTEKEVESGPAYTNRLPLATGTDRKTVYGEDYNGDGVNDGYITGKRLSSSGTESSEAAACASGFIFPVAEGDVIRIKGVAPIQSSASAYMVTYDSANTKIGYAEIPKISDKSDWSSTTTKSYYRYDAQNNEITITLDSTFGTGYNAIRFSAGTITADTIVTVNEEIKEGGGTTIVKEYDWVNTGHAFVPADYEDRIIDLEATAKEQAADIAKLKAGVSDVDDPIAFIREWDSPIYDRTPVWEISNEKSAITSTEKTVGSVYAKYDELMAANPDFITKTDLGLCSDGVTHVYRYDFKEREPRHQSGFEWSETKPKFIVVTGIHREWNGIYGMFHALSEITTNSELAELRRSVHFVVVPVLNPYSISGPYPTVGHAANANGVEIHRNFEVGFEVSGEGTIHYTGEYPLSEVESQYLDNILKDNADAAYFLTCHSFDRDKTWGVGFLWGSSATKYMCNMDFRVIDKMGKAWHKKYGTTWEDGIEAQNAYVLANPDKFPNAKALEAGDYRIGHAALTNTGGCEQRQATKYGIQATNFEVGETFFVLDETSLSAKAITHGAEAYVNFFLTAMDCYDFKDKSLYYHKGSEKDDGDDDPTDEPKSGNSMTEAEAEAIINATSSGILNVYNASIVNNTGENLSGKLEFWFTPADGWPAGLYGEKQKLTFVSFNDVVPFYAHQFVQGYLDTGGWGGSWNSNASKFGYAFVVDATDNRTPDSSGDYNSTMTITITKT